jgi:hypothetical protein
MTRAFMLSIACLAAAWGRPLASQAPQVRPATLLWQVDGSESGEPFGALRDLLLHRDGTVWALDFKDQVIRRYDARGKALPTVGRKGSGPGEMRNANGMALAPDGNVWVNDPSNGRLSVFAPGGQALRSVSLTIGGYRYRWEAWFEQTGELIEPVIGAKAQFRRLDATGKTLGTVDYPDCGSPRTTNASYMAENKDKDRGQLMGMYPFTSGGGIVSNRRGHFWCASAKGARVARLPYGRKDTVAVTSVDVPMVALTREERDAAIAQVSQRVAQYVSHNFDPSNVPNAKPGIAIVHLDSDGRLWVEHASKWKASSTTYDVFDTNGKSLFRVVIPMRNVVGLPVLAQGNELVLTVTDADDVVNIARFRLR